ncbi:hypothetical protein GIB67_022766 [Kingdonia uniflora]|uniref:RNA polymerase Rpb5 N-terminal domain-containing protein n=1 Tax=Kingdonia uniflora TaxID=39325 RepID=A0A7J7LJS7_9MAGN|nr:hypothetical protein GIB67_022766 [Kingdonia uniflora]
MENGGVCKSSWIDNGSIESHRFYLARRTTLEMLRDRGYNVSNSDIDLSLTQFRAKFTQKPNLTDLKIELPLKSNSSKKVAVLFCGTEKITKPMVGTLFNEGGKIVGLSRMILILQSDMTAQARQDLNLCRVKVETFHVS